MYFALYELIATLLDALRVGWQAMDLQHRLIAWGDAIDHRWQRDWPLDLWPIEGARDDS